jgi:hypothetical protein
MAARAPLLSRVRPASGGRGGPARGPGGAGRGGGRRACGGDGGGARAALFAAAAACAGHARISHFSERGSEARRAPALLSRPPPARPHVPSARPPPPPPAAPRAPRGWQLRISRALSFIRRLLTKWKVNYGCPEDPARGPTLRAGAPPRRGPPRPGLPLRGSTAAPQAIAAKGSALVLHGDLGCGKRKRWREAGEGGQGRRHAKAAFLFGNFAESIPGWTCISPLPLGKISSFRVPTSFS